MDVVYSPGEPWLAHRHLIVPVSTLRAMIDASGRLNIGPDHLPSNFDDTVIIDLSSSTKLSLEMGTAREQVTWQQGESIGLVTATHPPHVLEVAIQYSSPGVIKRTYRSSTLEVIPELYAIRTELTGTWLEGQPQSFELSLAFQMIDQTAAAGAIAKLRQIKKLNRLLQVAIRDILDPVAQCGAEALATDLAERIEQLPIYLQRAVRLQENGAYDLEQAERMLIKRITDPLLQDAFIAGDERLLVRIPREEVIIRFAWSDHLSSVQLIFRTTKKTRQVRDGFGQFVQGILGVVPTNLKENTHGRPVQFNFNPVEIIALGSPTLQCLELSGRDWMVGFLERSARSLSSWLPIFRDLKKNLPAPGRYIGYAVAYDPVRELD